MVHKKYTSIRPVVLASLATAMLVLGSAGKASAQVAGSVEDGLQQLAKFIVQKSTAADRSTIAVLPFPNADSTCSVLSTYIVDELIPHLFSVPDSRLEIVERAQLEALIAEIRIGEGGLLNPATTKKLGTQSGVSALAVGTITVYGDSIRINARLVATDSAKVISAAAVTIPKTQAVVELMSKPVTTGATCAPRDETAATQPSTTQPPQPTPSVGPAQSFGTATAAAPPAQVTPDQTAQMLVNGIRGTVTTAGRSKDGKRLSIALMIENMTDTEMRIALVGPAPVATDNEGSDYLFKAFSGASQCKSLEAEHTKICLEGHFTDAITLPRSSYSKLLPGSKTTLNFSFEGKDGVNGNIISFSANFGLLTVKTAASGDVGDRKVTTQNDDSQFELTTIGFGIPNIKLQSRDSSGASTGTRNK